MTAELGHFALIAALGVALVQSSLPLLGAARGRPRLMMIGEAAAQAQFVFVVVAFGALVRAYLGSDFSVANVAENSHTTKPWLYKLTGVWGNHEGSMLLWVLILVVFGAVLSVAGGRIPQALRARTLAVQAMVSAAFLAFILFAANPFARIFPAPVEGRDLNPILQDPGLAFHPPLLYLGYVGFSLVFAFAAAGLIEGRIDEAWARWVRPWVLIAWSTLTLGIGLGSWWAYYELGWGGFWFWDPVENASLMPWLAGTALLHSVTVLEKRGALKSWTVFLAILAFALSLVGTFLVRSGILVSVHAFASDPTRGLFILTILALAIGAALVLYAWRVPLLSAGRPLGLVSREGFLLVNNLLLATATATVFIGTLYPLALDALTGARISVGPPFFHATFVPLAIALLVLVPFGAAAHWKHHEPAPLLRLMVPALVLAGGAAVLVALVGPSLSLGGVAGLGLAAWLIAASLVGLWRHARGFKGGIAAGLHRLAQVRLPTYGMLIAHAGLGVAVAGIAGVSAGQIEALGVLAAGQSLGLGQASLRLERVVQVDGPNYLAERAEFSLVKGARVIATLSPERRFYPVQGTTTTEASIRTTVLADTYVVIGEPQNSDDGDTARYAVRAYYNPLAPWIWFGTGFMAIGGLCSVAARIRAVTRLPWAGGAAKPSAVGLS